MTCYRIAKGFICGPDGIVNLKPYGANVWMEWHHYHGPTFFRSENRIKPIYYPSKKTWQAFYKWQDNGRRVSIKRNAKWILLNNLKTIQQ